MENLIKIWNDCRDLQEFQKKLMEIDKSVLTYKSDFLAWLKTQNILIKSVEKVFDNVKI